MRSGVGDGGVPIGFDSVLDERGDPTIKICVIDFKAFVAVLLCDFM